MTLIVYIYDRGRLHLRGRLLTFQCRHILIDGPRSFKGADTCLWLFFTLTLVVFINDRGRLHIRGRLLTFQCRRILIDSSAPQKGMPMPCVCSASSAHPPSHDITDESAPPGPVSGLQIYHRRGNKKKMNSFRWHYWFLIDFQRGRGRATLVILPPAATWAPDAAPQEDGPHLCSGAPVGPINAIQNLKEKRSKMGPELFFI